MSTLDKDREASVTHQNAGVEHIQNGSFALAERELEQAVALDPDNHAAAYLLGQAYEEQKKPEKAADAYEKAVKYADKEAMYHYKAGKVLLDLGCASHNAMWEANHLLLFAASREWLASGTVNGIRNGVVTMGYPKSE